ncbi:MAG: acyl-CoA dehydrogenase family protein [Rhodocyclaceae bacterium]|nr:acyl-CoA dehydrogenase family protein [Rhodocyclaceae bacterium]
MLSAGSDGKEGDSTVNHLQQDVLEFRTHLARWVDERLIPQAEKLDESGDFSFELFRELGELGYFGIMYPEDAGGIGQPFPYTCYTILCEELARGSMGFAAAVCMQGSTATHTIHEWGNDMLREKYFLPAMRGEKIGAFAITEPNAGSDAASLRTRATKVDGGYLLNGSKIFTSNGTVADFITVVATTDPSKGAKGLELFVVDTESKGFIVGRKLDKFSIRCSDTAELAFEDLFVPDDHFMGDGKGGGFRRAYKALTVDRIFTAALALGTARAAYDAAVRYAGERSQFGQPIGKFQAVQFKLVDMLAKLEQARIYTYYASALADNGAPITTEAALAKIVAGENCNEVCQKALSVFGGYGLMNEYPVQRFLRDSYFPMVGGGTSDIMRIVVAKQIGL